MVGILAIVAGMAGFVRAESTVAEAAAACLILIGGPLVVALIRCRRYEVTIGERRIELRLGPFRRTLPAGCVENTTERPATSWRRLYTPQEMVLNLSVDARPLIVPTNEPDDLRVALVGRAASDQKSVISAPPAFPRETPRKQLVQTEQD